MNNKEDLAFEKYYYRFGKNLSFSPLYPIHLAQRRFPPKKLNLPAIYDLEKINGWVSYNGLTQVASVAVSPHCNTGPVGPAGVITPVISPVSSLSSVDSLSLSSDEDYDEDCDEKEPKLLLESMIHPTYIRNPRTHESLDDSNTVDRLCDETDWIIVQK